MAIAFQNVSVGDTPSATSPATITKPSGTTSTDVLVLCFSFSGPLTVTAPSGWTAIATQVGDSTMRCSAWWALGSVASLGFTFTSGNDVGWVCVGFTGVDNTTPVDATGTTATAAAATSVSAPAVTVVTSQAWHAIAAGAWNVGSLASATSFTARNNAATPNQPAAVLYNTTPKGTGSTGAVTVSETTAATGQHIAVIPFALRPAAAAGESSELIAARVSCSTP